jgi:protein-arginine kinase activator protein McsA
MCVDNSGFGEKISPKNLRKCKLAEYNEINDTYTCTECVLGYALDNVTQTCKQSIKISFKEKTGLSNCYTTNLGTKKEPKYSCVRCYSPFDLLVESESGINFCVTPYKETFKYRLNNPVYELEGCSAATVDTTYITNIYN